METNTVLSFSLKYREAGMYTQANKTMHDSELHFAPEWTECSDKDGGTKQKIISHGR